MTHSHRTSWQEQELEAIFSSTQLMIAYMDRAFNFIQVNQAYADAGGMAVEAFIGKNHFELYPDQENQQIFQQVVDSGEPYTTFEKPFEYPDRAELGVTYWDWTLSPVKDAADEVTGVVLTLLDVTAHVRLREQQQHAEQIFKSVFDHANDALLIHDADGRLLEVNPVACQWLQYPRDALLALSVAEIEAPEQWVHYPQRLALLQQQGRAIFDTEFMRKDGSRFPVEVSARGIEFNRQPAVLSSVRDISQRRLAERAMQESEENLHVLIDAITEFAALITVTGEVIAINRTGCQILQQPQPAVIGNNLFDFLPREYQALFDDYVGQMNRSGRAVKFEYHTGDQEIRVSLFPILGKRGQVSKVSIYAEDVTRRKRLYAIERMWSEVDQRLLRGDDFEQIIQHICQQVATLFGFKSAWIGKKENDGSVTMLAQAGQLGEASGMLKIGMRWDGSPEGKGATGAAIRSGAMQLFRTDAAASQPWAKLAVECGIGAVLGMPLIIRGEIFGAFTAYAEAPDAFDRSEVRQRLTQITNRIDLALEMAEDNQRLRLLGEALESAGNGIFICDRQGYIQWVNRAFCELLGFSREQIIGKTPRMFKSGQQPDGYYQEMWNTLLAGQVWSGEPTNRHRDGRLVHVQQTITPILDHKGDISHFISINEDVTEQKAVQARIHHMAFYDQLTGLPNRVLFFDRLSQAMVQGKRSGQNVVLLFVDLDRFKPVNDTYGHHVGDEVLKTVAHRLRSCVRESDTVARIAGDEFTVILSGGHYPDDAARVANKIVGEMAQPIQVAEDTIDIGASVGIACYPRDAASDGELLKAADQAMYLAKQQGRNQYYFFSADDEPSGRSEDQDG